MENCLRSLCTHQRPLNHLQTAISGLLGGPWLGLYGLGGHYVGPHGCSSTRIVTKSSPKPIPGATRGFPKQSNFGNLASVTKQPTQQQFRGFWGAHGSGYMGVAATTWVPMGAQVPALSLNHHPNSSQGRRKGFRKKANFGNLPGVTKQLTQAISRLLGGPWLGLYGLGGHYVGPHGCSSTRIVTKSSPKPIPGATEGFPKQWNFENLAGVTKHPPQQQFRGFWEGHGSGYMGLAATTWVPMGAQVPVLSLNHHPNQSQGRQKGFRNSGILEILQVSLNSLHNSNFGAFGGPMARAIWAWRPLRGSPRVLKCPYCH